jgi:hypothetical protein
VVDEIIAANPKQVEQVQTKPKTLGWFVGQVMRATGGKANPDAVNAIREEGGREALEALASIVGQSPHGIYIFPAANHLAN